jgi:cell division protein FtsL
MEEENKLKAHFIKQIIQDINDIPIIYLKTLYVIIHTFKENILVIEPISSQKLSQLDESDDFDWDNLIDEINTNRQKNNINRKTRYQLAQLQFSVKN